MPYWSLIFLLFGVLCESLLFLLFLLFASSKRSYQNSLENSKFGLIFFFKAITLLVGPVHFLCFTSGKKGLQIDDLGGTVCPVGPIDKGLQTMNSQTSITPFFKSLFCPPLPLPLLLLCRIHFHTSLRNDHVSWWKSFVRFLWGMFYRTIPPCS